MKFRHILPVVVLSVLVLALAWVSSDDVARAAEVGVSNTANGTGVANSSSSSHNVNHAISEIRLNLDDLDLGSSFTSTFISERTRWYNDSIIKDDVFKFAEGVNQVAAVSGSRNEVSQRATFFSFQDNTVTITTETVNF